MSTLYLYPIGGPVNRLRAFVGGAEAAVATGRDLAVFWDENSPQDQGGKFPCLLSELIEWKHRDVPADGQWVRHGFNALRSSGDVWVETWYIHGFLPWFNRPFREAWDAHFVPSTELQNVIQSGLERLASLQRPVIGVRLRQYFRDPRMAETAWFVERLRQIQCDVPEFSIYLMADDVAGASQVRAAFPGRVFEHPLREGSRYEWNRLAVFTSIADLYVLRKCDWCLGASYSSYSQTLALLRGAEHRGCNDEPGGVHGGRYDDAWNQPDATEYKSFVDAWTGGNS